MLVPAWVAALAIAVLATTARAQSTAPPCEPDDISGYRLLVLRQITSPAAERVYLQDQPRPCVSPTACSRGKGYLVSGDVVFEASDWEDFVCVHFSSGRRGLVAGWVLQSALAEVDEGPALTPTALAGTWTRSDADTKTPGSLAFTVTGGQLALEGTAYFQGTDPTDLRDAIIEGGAVLTGRAFLVNQDDRCIVWGVRRGPYLVVDESGGCGGFQAGFWGVYRKAAR
jgi:hypothetical protein